MTVDSYTTAFYMIVVGAGASPDAGRAISLCGANPRLQLALEEAVRKAAAGMGPRRIRIEVANASLDKLKEACGHDITIEPAGISSARPLISGPVKLGPPAWG